MKIDGADQRRRSPRRSVSDRAATVGRPPRPGQGSRAETPGCSRQSQETTAAGRQRPIGCTYSVADSVCDQFPFNSNQLRSGHINVDTRRAGDSYYSVLGCTARRQCASRDTSVTVPWRPDLASTVARVIFYAANATDATRKLTAQQGIMQVL